MCARRGERAFGRHKSEPLRKRVCIREEADGQMSGLESYCARKCCARENCMRKSRCEKICYARELVHERCTLERMHGLCPQVPLTHQLFRPAALFLLLPLFHEIHSGSSTVWRLSSCVPECRCSSSLSQQGLESQEKWTSLASSGTAAGEIVPHTFYKKSSARSCEDH